MRPRDAALAAAIESNLVEFAATSYVLPGIADPKTRSAFVEQLLESLHRIEYVQRIHDRALDPRRADPTSELFDPIKAAAIAGASGDHDEACWLVFLSVHFGRNHKSGWRLARDVYGRLGDEHPWTWDAVSDDTDAFLLWLESEEPALRASPGGFGNHRRYESISVSGTGETISSYIDWVNPPRTHAEMFDGAMNQAHGDAGEAFDLLFRSMREVRRFGRLGRFDYLCMLEKLGLATSTPAVPYMRGATGPLRGARRLFGADFDDSTMDVMTRELGLKLGVPMQAMEDSLCNWQKSPDRFVPFRG